MTNETNKNITSFISLHNKGEIILADFGIPLQISDLCIPGVSENKVIVKPDSTIVVHLEPSETVCLFFLNGVEHTSLDYPILGSMALASEEKEVLFRELEINKLFKQIDNGEFNFTITEKMFAPPAGASLQTGADEFKKNIKITSLRTLPLVFVQEPEYICIFIGQRKSNLSLH